MAEKKTIELEIKSNVGESIADLKALKRQLKDTAAGSEDFKKLYNQIDDLEDKIKSSKNASSDWIDSLESAGGPLGMVGGALNKAKVATQSFGGALKATGIGLFVSLIGGLVAAFQDNENAMKKIQPLLNGLGKLFNGVFRAVEPLFNTLVDLAISALPTVSKAFGVVYSSVTAVFQSLGILGSAIKKLISGDFSGAWKDAKSSVNDFSSNYDKSVKRFNEGTKEMSKTEKEEAEKRAEARKASQEKQAANDEKAKQERIRKAEEEKKRLEEIEKERQAFISSQGERARDEYEAAQKLIADTKKANEDALKTENQIKVEKENADFELKKQSLLQKGLSTEEIEKEHKRKLAELDTEYFASESDKSTKRDADEKAKADKLAQYEIDAQKRKYEALSLVTQGGMNLLAALQDAGIAKSKAGQMAMKALTLVQIGIDTASAFSNAVPMAIKAGAEAAKLAGPGAPIAGPLATAASYLSSATMIASNIAKAKKLLSSGGSATPASGGGVGGGAAPTPAAPAFNVVGASSTNQLAQTIGNQQQQPIKAYVVSNDVTTAQSLDRNIISSASIG
jgi:flagellar biosynthesis GTPase FlhF